MINASRGSGLRQVLRSRTHKSACRHIHTHCTAAHLLAPVRPSLEPAGGGGPGLTSTRPGPRHWHRAGGCALITVSRVWVWVAAGRSSTRGRCLAPSRWAQFPCDPRERQHRKIAQTACGMVGHVPAVSRLSTVSGGRAPTTAPYTRLTRARDRRYNISCCWLIGWWFLQSCRLRWDCTATVVKAQLGKPRRLRWYVTPPQLSRHNWESRATHGGTSHRHSC